MADSPMMVAKRRLVLLWSAILIVATFGVIGGFIMYWLKTRPARFDTGAPVAPRHERVVSRHVSPDEDEALRLVRAALASGNEVEAARHFRTGAGGAAEVLEMLRAEPDGGKWKLDWMGSLDTDGQILEGVMVTPEDGDPARQRLAFLAPDEKGVWKVDFDSFARICRPSWEDLLDGGARRAEVRVLIASDSYFNGPFASESEWSGFTMVSPDVKADEGDVELLRGYAAKGSPQARALERIFQNQVRMARVTLEVTRAPGAEARQFEITRVLSNEWVVGTKAFDERFREDETPPKDPGRAARE